MTFSLSVQSTNELLILRKELGEKGTGDHGDFTISSSQVRTKLLSLERGRAVLYSDFVTIL
jgi:hypothetical protein